MKTRFRDRTYEVVRWYLTINFVLAVIATLVDRRYGSSPIAITIVLSLEAYYLAKSLRAIEPDQIGGIVFLGQPLYDKSAGFVFVPWIFCKLTTITKQKFQLTLPAKPEEIGDEPGKVKPMRITTVSKEVAQEKWKDHPTYKMPSAFNEAITLEMIVSVTGTIESVCRLLETFGSIERIRDLMREPIESKLVEEFSTRTPALVMAHIRTINEAILEMLRELIKDKSDTTNVDESWPIEIESIQLSSPDMSRTVNQAVAEQAAAVAQREARINRAKGEKEAMVLEAEGRERLAQALAKPGARDILAAETAVKIAKETETLIVTGPQDLLGLAAKIKAVFGDPTNTAKEEV